MPLNLSFNLPPEEAIKFFRSKGLNTTFDWREMLHTEHDTAFTVAKMMDIDLLKDVKQAVDKALATGQTLKEFKDGLTPLLRKKGWWGRKDVKDPITGEIVSAQLGSPRRLRTIFETNLKTAYAAGHWKQIQETKKTAPWLMYDAINDGRTRPQHRAWDETVLKIDDPWWRTHYPPNGWNCRCGVIQLSERQMKEMGLKPTKAPKKKKREWINPRTGEIMNVPEGIDPGWAYHVGRERERSLLTPLAEKLEGLDAPMAHATLEGLISSPAFKSWFENPKGAYPVLRLDEKAGEAIKAERLVALLSEESVIKNKTNHPDLDIADYLVLPSMGAEATVIVKDGPNTIVIVKKGKSIYWAAVKAARTEGKETFVTSFRKTNKAGVKALIKKGKIIYGEWK